MGELAALVRLHGPGYRAKFGDRRPPRHLRALPDLERCRPEPLGGQVSHWETGHASRYSDHAGKNRPCPKGQRDQAEPWREDQNRLRLPVPHGMVTFTLPAELSALARRPQTTLYTLLFRRSSEALQALARAPRCIGGRTGRVGVLPPWPRALRSHPPVP